MAEGIKFPESNIIFTKPRDMTDEECGSLPAYYDGKECISCWKFTSEELEEVKKTGVVWLSVLGGQPPVYITGNKPFEEVKTNRVFACCFNCENRFNCEDPCDGVDTCDHNAEANECEFLEGECDYKETKEVINNGETT